MCDRTEGIEKYNSVGSVDEPLAVTGRMLAQVDRAGGVGGAELYSVGWWCLRPHPVEPSPGSNFRIA